MRLTIRTDLAARVLMYCAMHPDRIVRSSEIADCCNSSGNHLLQVVNLLQAHGFIDTVRGRAGGMRLARPIEEISIGQVFRAFEGAVPLAECFDEATNSCPLRPSCRLRTFLVRAEDAFYQELDKVTLADLVGGNCGFEAMLKLRVQLAPTCGGQAGGD
jgi:Rrf2 family transcriptional regulator, nitric oxide-sensitive transcriptional repressor